MSDDKLAFLDRPRDDHGRFAPTKSEPAPAPVATEAPPPSQPEPAPPAVAPEATAPAAPPQDPAATTRPDPGYVPIAALLDTREQAQKAKREAEEYKRKWEESQKRPAPIIDPIADPEGFARTWEERQTEERQKMLFETSFLVALQQHGNETVNAAEEWLKSELETNPGLLQTIMRQRHPYDFVVQQHKRSLNFAKLGDDDPETWFEKRAKELGYVKLDQQAASVPSAAAPSPQQGTPLPRPSLASAPSVGGSAPKVPTGPGVAFETVFKQ